MNLWLFIFENVVNVASKINMQKNGGENNFYLSSWRLLTKIPGSVVRGTDPRIRIRTKMSRIRNTASYICPVSMLWRQAYNFPLYSRWSRTSSQVRWRATGSSTSPTISRRWRPCTGSTARSCHTPSHQPGTGNILYVLMATLKGDFLGFLLFLYDIQHSAPTIPLCRRMLGSNPGQLRLRHWLSDALTTRL